MNATMAPALVPFNGTSTNGTSLHGTRAKPTLSQVRERIEADDKGKWDTIVTRGELALRDGELAFPAPNGEEMRLGLSRWASGQFCTRLGIPAGYFRRCPTVLQDQQANYWLKEVKEARATHCKTHSVKRAGKHDGKHCGDTGEENEANEGDALSSRWRLRAHHGQVRAVLSNRYAPLDNSVLMESLTPILDSHYQVDWFGLTGESLHLRVIDPKKTREILPSDALSVGVHIANSEVGFRSVTVDALVYRLVCSNGLIRLVKGKSLLRQRHVHLQEPRFVAALEEAVANAFVTADEFLEQMKRSAKEPVADVEATIERIGERWNLSESTTETAKILLLREPAGLQETLYGVVNAFTAVAQRLPDEDRYDLEVLAGRLAEHGVAAYAPQKSLRRRIASNPDAAIALAKELFEAQVVPRATTPEQAMVAVA